MTSVTLSPEISLQFRGTADKNPIDNVFVVFKDTAQDKIENIEEEYGRMINDRGLKEGYKSFKADIPISNTLELDDNGILVLKDRPRPEFKDLVKYFVYFNRLLRFVLFDDKKQTVTDQQKIKIRNNQCNWQVELGRSLLASGQNMENITNDELGFELLDSIASVIRKFTKETFNKKKPPLDEGAKEFSVSDNSLTLVTNEASFAAKMKGRLICYSVCLGEYKEPLIKSKNTLKLALPNNAPVDDLWEELRALRIVYGKNPTTGTSEKPTKTDKGTFQKPTKTDKGTSTTEHKYHVLIAQVRALANSLSPNDKAIFATVNQSLQVLLDGTVNEDTAVEQVTRLCDVIQDTHNKKNEEIEKLQEKLKTTEKEFEKHKIGTPLFVEQHTDQLNKIEELTSQNRELERELRLLRMTSPVSSAVSSSVYQTSRVVVPATIKAAEVAGAAAGAAAVAAVPAIRYLGNAAGKGATAMAKQLYRAGQLVLTRNDQGDQKNSNNKRRATGNIDGDSLTKMRKISNIKPTIGQRPKHTIPLPPGLIQPKK